MSDNTNEVRPFQRVLIDADDQEVTLSLVHGDIGHLDYYVDDGKTVRCPACDRRVTDDLVLSSTKTLWNCLHCRHKFIVVSMSDEPIDLVPADEVFDQMAGQPEPAQPSLYERMADMSRRAMYQLEQTAAIEQAKAWCTYGDTDTALQVLEEFLPRFTKRFGALP